MEKSQKDSCFGHAAMQSKEIPTKTSVFHSFSYQLRNFGDFCTRIPGTVTDRLSDEAFERCGGKVHRLRLHVNLQESILLSVPGTGMSMPGGGDSKIQVLIGRITSERIQ